LLAIAVHVSRGGICAWKKLKDRGEAMTDISLAERKKLRELYAKATPGEWRWLPSSGNFIVSEHGTVAEIPCRGCNPRDGAFIVAMHEALPALLDRIDELEQPPAPLSDEQNFKLCANRFEIWFGWYGRQFCKPDWQLEDAFRAGWAQSQIAFRAAIDAARAAKSEGK
jgi:hypothetical protein